MLPDKDINKISELKNSNTTDWLAPHHVIESLKAFNFSSLSKAVAEIKSKGYSFEWILTLLISLPYVATPTVHSLLNGSVNRNIEAGKDTFYRLKNNSSLSWRLLLWLFAAKFKNITAQRGGKSASGIKCLIIDDSLLAKTGFCMERIGKLWDHVTQRYILGYRLLLAGYWDGTSMIPLDFTFHREKGKKKNKPYGLSLKQLRKQFHKDRSKNCAGYERLVETDMSKIDCAIKMFKRAIAQGFVVDYILIDSWFTCEAILNAALSVKKHTVHVIGMYKIVKTKFLFQGEMLTHKEIRQIAGKEKRCRKLGYHYKEAQVEYLGRTIRLFFSKKGKNGKWKVFLCTDTKLTYIKMLEIYQKRWAIEVFFKEAKQLLGLGKCQSNDFDAQIADATIVMIQYTLLTLRYRVENYESLYGLFADLSESTTQQRLDQRLWGLFCKLVTVITKLFPECDDQQMLRRIFHDEEFCEFFHQIVSVYEYVPLKEAS